MLNCIFLIAEQTTIKIGVYQNNPKVFVDEHGKIKGFFVDITNEIAKINNFKINYVFGEWHENIKKLENGEIDCVLDASYTEERNEKFLFNKIKVIESWIQVFALEELKIDDIKDFKDKRIAVVANSTQDKFLRDELKKSVNFNYKILIYKNYDEMSQAVINKKADMLLGNRFFYYSKERNPKLVPKSVIINPNDVFYMFRKNYDKTVVEKFDNTLFNLKRFYVKYGGIKKFYA